MLNDFVSLFFPRYCMSCNKSLVKGEKLICLHCHYTLPTTNSHLDEQNYIAIKFYGRVKLQHAVSFFTFSKSGKVQRLLHRLKYDNKPDIGIYLGEKYAHELKAINFAQHYDIIVPVPLHRSRLKRRGYNQSAAFAEGLSTGLGLPAHNNLLTRNIKTSTQTRKSRLERWHNVDQIFTLPDPEMVAGQRVLLIDDVITTGSTLESCATTLLDAGCASVGVAAIAAAK